MTAKAHTCKGCHKPIFQSGDKWEHDRRVTAGAPPSGVKERRAPIVTKEDEPAPVRFHLLNTPLGFLFGRRQQG